MKKLLLVLAGAAMLAFGFTSCGDKPADTPSSKPEQDAPAPETPAGPEVLKTFAKGDKVIFADFEITADNAADYVVKVSFTVTDDSKLGWGAGAVCDGAWTDAKVNALEVNAEGFIEISVSDIIAKLPTEFLINWWAEYATLDKIELIKK